MNKLQSRTQYLANHPTKLKAKIKTLLDKQREFVDSRSALQTY